MRHRTWARVMGGLFIVCGVGGPAAASQQAAGVPKDPKKDAISRPRAAWKWTLEERLAARFDPQAVAAREAEYQAEQEKIFERLGDPLAEEAMKMTNPPATTEHLDGRKTPELFLPGELFTLLIIRGFSPQGGNRDVRGSRDPIEERAAALGFGRDLWVRLETAATPYLQLLREGGPGEGDESEQAERDINLCRQRARALKAAKAEFGEEMFLRLLYEAVAPTARPIYFFEGTNYYKYAENLRRFEEGCH
jgi:hypothetical protein